MASEKRTTLIFAAAVVIASVAFQAAGMAQMCFSEGSSHRTESSQSKIARALSAGPSNVSKDATVAEMDSHGHFRVLRQGTNGWTCMPGSAAAVGQPPMCADEVAMQWNKDFI